MELLLSPDQAYFVFKKHSTQVREKSKYKGTVRARDEDEAGKIARRAYGQNIFVELCCTVNIDKLREEGLLEKPKRR